MKDYYAPAVEFRRTFNGAPAAVIYLCNGTKAFGGLLVAQVIYVNSTERDIQNEVARQR